MMYDDKGKELVDILSGENIIDRTILDNMSPVISRDEVDKIIFNFYRNNPDCMWSYF